MKTAAGPATTAINIYTARDGDWSIMALITNIITGVTLVAASLLTVVFKFIDIKEVQEAHLREFYLGDPVQGKQMRWNHFSTSFSSTFSQTIAMIIYQDLISGDDLIDDTFDIKEIDPITYEVDCHYIEVPCGDGGDSGDDGDFGQGADDQKKTVIDIIHAFRLQSVPPFDKKTFLAYIKKNIKVLTPKLDAEAQEDFKKNIEGFAKKIQAHLDEYQCYVGESLHEDGMVVLLKYREDGVTPYVTFVKHGLKGVPS